MIKRVVGRYLVVVAVLLLSLLLMKYASERAQYTINAIFELPKSVAIDSQDNVYLITNSGCIMKFTSTWKVLAKWGEKFECSKTTTYSRFVSFDKIVISQHDEVYATDFLTNDIYMLGLDGQIRLIWPGEYQDKKIPSHDGNISVAIDSQGNIYVASPGNNAVYKFNKDGEFLAKWGEKGSKDGQFNFGYFAAIAVDSRGNIYVVDTNNNRIQNFDSNGQFIMKWGSKGRGDDEFWFPNEIGVDNEGNVYIFDTGNSRIQKFTDDGRFLLKWGTEGSGDNQFSMTTGSLAVDKQGFIYVADVGNNRIQKFDSNGHLIGKLDSPRRGEPVLWYLLDGSARLIAVVLTLVLMIIILKFLWKKAQA